MSLDAPSATLQLPLPTPLITPTHIPSTPIRSSPSSPPTKLHYQSQGSGPTIILIPGGHGTSLLFTPLALSLSKAFRVITYDRRGYHRSSHLPHPARRSGAAIKAHVDDLAVLIRSVQRSSDEKVILFGSSWAAYIAVSVLLRYPDLVEKVVLHEPIFVSFLPQKTQEILRVKILEMLAVFAGKGTGAANRLLMPLISSAEDRRAFTTTSVYKELLGQKSDFFAMWYEHEYAESLTFKLDLEGLNECAMREKVVLMLGDDPAELAFPTEPVKILARVLGRDVIRAPGGHMGYVTKEGEFAGVLERALGVVAGVGIGRVMSRL
ncbi:Alpha/Beta hydrolase protein [Aspergillus karnatakaensis]|uniref:alpha/beta hydrolase n=1 Tax=Aspergillus karnatakaensis TaxID=1810916 RepID=UPI003CCD586A